MTGFASPPNDRAVDSVLFIKIVVSLSTSWSPRTHLHVVGMLRLRSFDINQPSLPTPFYYAVRVSFCLYGPFNCILFHKFSQQLSAFSFCSSGLISINPFNYICFFLKVSHIFSSRDSFFFVFFLHGYCLAARRS